MVKARVDITYPNEKGKFVVIYKQGDEIKDAKLIDVFRSGAPDLIIDDDKPVKKPSRVGKKKGKRG